MASVVEESEVSEEEYMALAEDFQDLCRRLKLHDRECEPSLFQ